VLPFIRYGDKRREGTLKVPADPKYKESQSEASIGRYFITVVPEEFFCNVNQSVIRS